MMKKILTDSYYEVYMTKHSEDIQQVELLILSDHGVCLICKVSYTDEPYIYNFVNVVCGQNSANTCFKLAIEATYKIKKGDF